MGIPRHSVDIDSITRMHSFTSPWACISSICLATQHPRTDFHHFRDGTVSLCTWWMGFSSKALFSFFFASILLVRTSFPSFLRFRGFSARLLRRHAHECVCSLQGTPLVRSTTRALPLPPSPLLPAGRGSRPTWHPSIQPMPGRDRERDTPREGEGDGPNGRKPPPHSGSHRVRERIFASDSSIREEGVDVGGGRTERSGARWKRPRRTAKVADRFP